MTSPEEFMQVQRDALAELRAQRKEMEKIKAAIEFHGWLLTLVFLLMLAVTFMRR